jgi:hypothetical protein
LTSDNSDVDAQIQRCKERIEEGILPLHFEWRLEDYMVAKKYRE